MKREVENERRPRATSVRQAALAKGAERDWNGAHEILRAADARGGLDAEALELLAEAARWTGNDEGIVDPLERAHVAWTAQGDSGAAARTALALVRFNADHRRDAIASTWLARAAELLEGLPEQRWHGWLAWHRSRDSGNAGEAQAQREQAQTALEIAQRRGDRGLEALALVDLAHVAAAIGPAADALTLAERAAAIALSGETDIWAAGDVLCNAIWLSRSRGEWDRAQQWVESSTRWVERQKVQYFPAMCRLHRAEVLRVRGKLDDAERESVIATRMLERSLPSLSMFAFAELGEVRRRRGDAEAALDAFGKAAQLGWDPQPGMALVLLATGRGPEAMRAIERVFRVPPSTFLLEDKANLLAARTTVALANAELDKARSAADALAELASGTTTAWDHACSAQARGRFDLATGRAEPAIDRLTLARRAWTSIDAPFELATTSVLLGEAFAKVGDQHQARITREAARELFGRMGALRGGEGAERQLAGLTFAQPVAISSAAIQNSATTSSVIAAEVDEGRASLVREGDYWSLCFVGRTVRLKQGRGVQYLAELLARPGETIWAIELASAGESEGERAAADGGNAGPKLDARARAEYAKRLRELEDELDDARTCADARRVEAARTEMDALGRELAAAVGLGGRDRRTGAASERARQSVTKAIRAVLKKLESEHAPLGEHLLACVRTGTACTFQPEKRRPITWAVRR